MEGNTIITQVNLFHKAFSYLIRSPNLISRKSFAKILITIVSHRAFFSKITNATNLEESKKDVRVGIGQENEGQECTEAAMENGWSDGRDGRCGSFVPRSRFHHECVGNVSSVVDAQPDSQHEIDARNSVDS